MPNIPYLTGDLFADTAMSIENKTAGFLDFVTRFAAADLPTTGPQGELVLERRAANEALAVLLRRAQATAGGSQASQQADHAVTEAQRTVALDFVTRLDALITGLIEDKETQAQVRMGLLPQGRYELNTAKVDELGPLLQVIEMQLGKQVAAFGSYGPDLLAQAAAAFAPYATARRTETVQQSTTDQARRRVHALLPLVGAALTAGLHLACYVYIPQPERAATLFNRRYFERRRVSNPPGVRRRRLAAGQHRGLFDLRLAPGLEATRVTLQVAPGRGAPLLLARTADADTPPDPAAALTLLPGEEQTVELAALGTGPWLVALNTGPRGLSAVARLD
jgi:hypothetical protein